MDPLDILEKRIKSLEHQIYPRNSTIAGGDKTEPITDLLIQTQTMISSALSCRDSITTILKHMPTINDYLDPGHGDDDLEVEAKRQYLLELYPRLVEIGEMYATFEGLTRVLDSPNIAKIADASDRLDGLAVGNLRIYEESNEVTGNTAGALQRYSDINGSLKVLFAQMNRAVSELEMARVPKVASDD